MSVDHLMRARVAEAERRWGVLVGESAAALRAAPTLATAREVLSLTGAAASWREMIRQRIFFLRSFTVEPIVPFLQALTAVHGVACDVRVGGFNTYAQEIHDQASDLYAWDPNCAIFAIRTPDLLPQTWTYFEECHRDTVEAEISAALVRMRGWIEMFRRRTAATLIIHDLESPQLPAGGMLDAQRLAGQTNAIRRFNRELTGLASDFRGVHVFAYDDLVARHGRLTWYDEAKWLTARMPVAAGRHLALADEYSRMVLPAAGRTCKVIVLDLDNTLWGGVVGEDGVDGIQLGGEYPGAFFSAFQRALLACARRGILLAICSKNNESDAMQAIREHPGMLLRPEHFACFRINWQDKATNLREIAASLNVGVDSLLFIDDNPAERDHVRRALPESSVLELPKSPAEYARALWECPLVHRLSLSDEDRSRTQQYAEERERRDLRDQSESFEEFLASLGTTISIAQASSRTIPRIAQLTQKTNQFNLSTRRYTEAAIERVMDDPAWCTFAVHARDRFGDHGLVGLALVRHEATAAVIDTFLLSCRVIGRGIETVMLVAILEQCKAWGVATVVADYIPTNKNAPARSFLGGHGFQSAIPASDEQAVRHELNVTSAAVTVPAWIKWERKATKETPHG